MFSFCIFSLLNLGYFRTELNSSFLYEEMFEEFNLEKC